MQNATGLFNVLKEKLRLQHNETTPSLQYYILHRKDNESKQEWRRRLCIRATEYNYKEHKAQKQFIDGKHYEEIIQEIIKELMAQNNTQEIVRCY